MTDHDEDTERRTASGWGRRPPKPAADPWAAERGRQPEAPRDEDLGRAEDLVQDTLLRAFRAIERFDGRHPRAWLLTIMRNTEINRNRRRRPGLLTADQAAQIDQAADDGASAEDEALDRSLGRDVAAALAQLPDPFREAVELIDLAGLSYTEAAEVAGVPEGTLMSRAHRARRKLRAHLRSSDVDLRGTP